MAEFKPKTYFIKTFGCQANVADSNTLAGILEALGFEEVSEPKNVRSDKEMYKKVLPETDLFIVNTCSVRQKSEDKVYGLGKAFADFPKGKKKPFTVMAGCMVGSVTGDRTRFTPRELKNKTPWVDEYINPSQIFEIPAILLKNNLLDEWALKRFNPEKVQSKQKNKIQAFVNISNGCDNYCRFCVVPFARGKEVSRSKKEILNEIKQLVNRGITEITLCGQNVNSWGLSWEEKFKIRSGSDQKLPFAALLREIHKIPEIKKIDFISSNPFDFTQDLIDTLKLSKISNYLHIAIQSGNNKILKKMNRRHTIEDFLTLIAKIQKAQPKVELGTDAIVGFPGETKAQFEDTVKIFQKVPFNVAFISMYSPRKGTPAEIMYKDDVSLDEKKRRHAQLVKVWKKPKKEIRKQ